MIDIQVEGVVKAFEIGNNILDGLTFQIDQGERVGLLGRNGAGKTTLFRILTGELDCDEGSVVIGKGRRLGLISQIPVYPAGYTVEDVLHTAFSRIRSLAEEMERVTAAMAAGENDPMLLKRYGALSEKFELFGGYEKLKRIMCENGVRVVFTGHTHVQGIKKYEDSEGRYFYDITTSALPSAAGRMRKVVFDKEKGTCSVESVGIEKIEGVDTKGLSARDYIYSLNFIGLVEKSLPLMDTDWEAFCENMDRVFSVPFFRKHPAASRLAIKRFLKIKMSFVGRFGRKYGNVTKEDIKYLKNMYFADAMIKIVASVFGGNGPFPPHTPEYRALRGGAERGIKLLKIFGVDLDKIIPGEETALETMNHFLYNDRTGDDNSIIIDMERK